MARSRAGEIIPSEIIVLQVKLITLYHACWPRGGGSSWSPRHARVDSLLSTLGGKTPVASDLSTECGDEAHVLPSVLKICPNQATSLQGSHGVRCDILAANDLGNGSGWQQNKQNWALLAVVGEQV